MKIIDLDDERNCYIGSDGEYERWNIDPDVIIEQPEIVRCKNCKHNQLPSTSGNAICEIYYGMTDREGFCHMAERRTDE